MREPLVFDQRRRGLELSIADIARMTGIRYRRLWRAFVDGSEHLSDDERKVLIAALGLEDHDVARKQ